jgi:hypothetical protein
MVPTNCEAPNYIIFSYPLLFLFEVKMLSAVVTIHEENISQNVCMKLIFLVLQMQLQK